MSSQLFFWGPQKSILIGAWHDSKNLCGEDQTLMVMNKVYVFHIGQGHPNSPLIVILLIETHDCNYPLNWTD